MTEDEMVGWHHQLDGHAFEQILGDSEGQENLVCCSPWCHKESNTTEQLNNNKTTKACRFFLSVPTKGSKTTSHPAHLAAAILAFPLSQQSGPATSSSPSRSQPGCPLEGRGCRARRYQHPPQVVKGLDVDLQMSERESITVLCGK